MNEEVQNDILAALNDIRDGQREVISLLATQQELTREQMRRSKEMIDESVSLQRLGLKRQQTITFIAIPGILACIAAIAYLVWRYF